jgi:hypothetical protein
MRPIRGILVFSRKRIDHCRPYLEAKRKNPRGLAQLIERASSAKRIQGNPTFSLIFLAWAWFGFRGFG